MSLFDKFFNASTKLQPVVEPQDTDNMPGGSGAKILSSEITKKLAQRHQLMMTAAREKTNENEVHQDAAATSEHHRHAQHEKKDKKFGNNDDEENDKDNKAESSSSSSGSDDDDDENDASIKLNPATSKKEEKNPKSKLVVIRKKADDDDDNDDEESDKEDFDDDDDDDEVDGKEATSLFSNAILLDKSDGDHAAGSTAASSWGKKGDGDNDFLVFGGAKANALKGATNTSKAVELSAVDHYMAPVAAFTYVQYPSKSADEPSSEKAFRVTSLAPSANPDEKFTIVEKMVSVDTCVPLWAAHRFAPRSLLSKPADAASDDAAGVVGSCVDTRLKTQLASPTPVNKKEAAAVRNYLNGYSPIDSIALHQEIIDFHDYIRPTEGEVILRRFIETQISNIARGLFPNCDPIVYGSVTTGLVLPYSDIDMSVLNVTNSSVEDGLLALQKQITLNALCEGHAPQVILKTRVPLIKFTSSIAPLDIDVSINAADGQKNSEYVSKMLGKFPEAKYLIVLVKYFLNQRDMNEPYRGGVGSFACTLLVISFLQHHAIYTTDCPNRQHYGLGRLFVDFLQYYGTIGFNTERIGISLRIPEMTAEHGSCFFQREGPHSVKRPGMPGKGPTKMDIEDPVTTDNNAASSVRLIQMVQSSFEGALLLLTARAPALNSLLAPAHLFPKREQLYQPPVLFPSTDSKGFRALFDGVDPVNDHVLKRPTLLSRIIHHDVSLVEKRNTIHAAFGRFQRDQISKEGQLFKEVVAMVKKSKMFQQLVEVRTRHRYDDKSASASTQQQPGQHFHHKVVPHCIFSLGYDQVVHEEYFKAKVAELVEQNKMTLVVLAHQQVVKNTGSGKNIINNNNNNSNSQSATKKNNSYNQQLQQQLQVKNQSGQRRDRGGDQDHGDDGDQMNKKKSNNNSQLQQKQQTTKESQNNKKRNQKNNDSSDEDGTFNSNAWQGGI